MTEITQVLPLLPLRDVVIFPHMVIPLFVRREESIRALEAAMAAEEQKIFLVAQRDQLVEEPKQRDLFKVGTVSTILQLLRLPDGSVKVLVEGVARATFNGLENTSRYYEASVSLLQPKPIANERGLEALKRALLMQFERLSQEDKKVRSELLASFTKIEDPDQLADSIASHLSVKVDQKQQVLEAIEIPERLNKVSELLSQELEMIKVEEEVQKLVESRVKNTQRHYYLSEKMRAIQEELEGLDRGSGAGAAGAATPFNEQEELKKKIEKAGMPKEAKEKALSEFAKLKMMPPMSAEATVCRNYLDTMLQVPWRKKNKINTDLKHAEKILDRDHYGLKEVKERILEYLAVQLRVKKLKGPILCLVGPPGVGKTSLGRSIAEATGRQFARVALGGVRDEAEIRGHRRTYIGAMPGKIIQRLIKVKARNPLFMLDEVDKMAMDFRGDPASALLEVLDPEQNHAFGDHYLEVDCDLTDVMFIATANSMDIPAALLDRMEIIRIPGYTESEKVMIAKNYLIPRQKVQNGLEEQELKISDSAILEMIRTYTREAGVRSLEREIAKVCRKVVRDIVSVAAGKSRKAKETAKKAAQITVKNLETYLGVKRYRFGLAEEDDQVGHVTGLAWTEVGGELLTIEAQTMPGKGKSQYTGRLGDVMQESIHAATSVVRSRAASIGINHKFFQENDIHIHVPEGATPKDGPSAGIGMCTALVSAVAQIPVRADVAMTGEITLRGEVLPIGGLKEKLLAAMRGGIKHVLIPDDNRRDLKEIPEEVKKALKITPVKWIDEVLEIALTSTPIPLESGDERAMAAVAEPASQSSLEDAAASAETH